MSIVSARASRPSRWTAARVSVVWRNFDLQLTTYAALLLCFGLAMAYSNTVATGDAILDGGSIFLRALMWTSIAVAVFVTASVFDYHWLKTFAWPLYLVQIGLLIVTLAIGGGVGGTSRWVSIFGLQFQFSELAKVLMIIVLANYLGSRAGKLGSLWQMVGAGVLAGPPFILVLLQPDLGTALVFGAILIATLFMSGASLRWLGIGFAAAMAALPFVWTYVLADYQKARLTSFLNPLADIQGAGYQLYQAQIAIGAGGWFGLGLTNGTQNAQGLLPVQDTDFVFAILAEELGFVGALVVMGLFVALLWRVLVAGWRSKDPFGTIFACGVGAMLLFQLFVNVGMVIGIMPITGIPLPFISHGGASLISIALALGLLQSINIRQGRAEW
ncbi:MAG TPA: rod shape-determining protein RodA [Candidatus Limnocylindrales bacterium]|jgi:rod shape determining protein RodA|nr:rod shape-determining protein RodA [Candidatus Limnocylindrales bacterium]